MINLFIAGFEGLVGSILWTSYLLYKGEPLKTNYQKIFSRLIMGAIVGILWNLAGFPNHFNTIMAGMLAPEIIDGFITKFRLVTQKTLKTKKKKH